MKASRAGLAAEAPAPTIEICPATLLSLSMIIECARPKPNVADIRGGLNVAAAFGVLAQSWFAFGAARVILLVECPYEEDVRPRGRGR